MKNLSIGMKMIIAGMIFILITYVLEYAFPSLPLLVNYIITGVGILLIIFGFIKDRKSNNNR